MEEETEGERSRGGAVGGIEERCWKSPPKVPTGISGHRRAAETRAAAKTSDCVMDPPARGGRRTGIEAGGRREVHSEATGSQSAAWSRQEVADWLISGSSNHNLPPGAAMHLQGDALFRPANKSTLSGGETVSPSSSYC